MARKATEEEERILSGEAVLSQEQVGAEFPLVELKVVYLGGHPKKTVRMKGQIIREDFEDPDDPKRKIPVFTKSSDGYTTYDFSTVDERGRKITVNMTKDNKRFQVVRHLDHLMQFYQTRGQDKEPMFEIRGNPEYVEVLRDYIKAKKKHVNPDAGPAVLKAMGLTE